MALMADESALGTRGAIITGTTVLSPTMGGGWVTSPAIVFGAIAPSSPRPEGEGVLRLTSGIPEFGDGVVMDVVGGPIREARLDGETSGIIAGWDDDLGGGGMNWHASPELVGPYPLPPALFATDKTAIRPFFDPRQQFSLPIR